VTSKEIRECQKYGKYLLGTGTCYYFDVRNLSAVTSPKLYRFDREYGFWGVPNFSQRIFYPEYDRTILVRHDDLGNRNTDIPKSITSKNKSRILFLGGSHTWGAGVENYETFPAVIQESSGLSCLNYGHCSFGLDQMVLVLLKQLNILSVETVVLELHPWVIHRVLRKSAIGFPKPYFALHSDELKLHQVPPIASAPFVRRFLSDFAVFEKSLLEFRSGINLKETSTNKKADPLFKIWNQAYYSDLYKIISRLLVIARDVCIQNQTKLLIVLGPTKQELSHHPRDYEVINPSIPRRRIKALMDNENLQYLDLEPNFKFLRHDVDNGLFPDGHINRRGHKIFAEEILGQLS
jgi:hypothetical protein